MTGPAIAVKTDNEGSSQSGHAEFNLRLVEGFDNCKGGSITVRQGKGGEDRVVRFGSYAAAALRTYLKGRASGPLFLSEPRSQRGTVDFYDGYRRTYWTGWWWEWKPLPDGKPKRVMHKVYLGTFEELPTKEAAQDALMRFIDK